MDGKCWNLFQFLIFLLHSLLLLALGQIWIEFLRTSREAGEERRCDENIFITYSIRYEILCRRYNNKNYMRSQDLVKKCELDCCWRANEMLLSEINQTLFNFSSFSQFIRPICHLNFALAWQIGAQKSLFFQLWILQLLALFHLSMMASSKQLFSFSILSLKSCISADSLQSRHILPLSFTTIRPFGCV